MHPSRFQSPIVPTGLCRTIVHSTTTVAMVSVVLVSQAGAQPGRVTGKTPAGSSRTALPMVVDQPLVCPSGRVRSEQAIAHETVVPASTLTTVRFDAAPLPPGALVSGRVTWRLRPTSVPSYSAGIFNIAAQALLTPPVPGAQTAVQIHHIGSVPASATHPALRQGPWDAVAVPAAVLVAADLHGGVIAQFNVNRTAAPQAPPTAVFLQSQVGSRVQTSFAILETCHLSVSRPAPSHTVPRLP